MNECMVTITSREGPGIIFHSRYNVKIFNSKLNIGKDIFSELQDRTEKNV